MGLSVTHWRLVVQIVIGVSLFAAAWSYLPTLWGAPWVSSSLRTANKMLLMAEVTPGQKVVDLGAGDGRIVLLAARRFAARAAGVEIDPLRCLIGNALIWGLGLHRQAHVYCGHMYNFDLADADVVTLYLLQGTDQKLKTWLGEHLRPGVKVVSRSFSMAGWSPVAIDDANDIFLYEIGATGPGVKTRFV